MIVLVVTAMRVELNKSFLTSTPCKISESLYLENVNGCSVYHLITGVGKLNAAIATYKTLDFLSKLGEEIHVLNVGFVGGTLDLRDRVAIVSTVRDMDGDVKNIPALREPKFLLLFTDIDRLGYVECDCWSSQSFVTGERIENTPDVSLSKSVFDMELYGIAKVCEEFDYNLVSLKVVSDCPQKESFYTFEQFVDNFYTFNPLIYRYLERIK